MKQWLLGLGLLVLAAGCARQFPYRSEGLPPLQSEAADAVDCRALYNQYSDGGAIASSDLGGERGECWERSLEQHERYDLMFVEFDDQGWIQNSSSLRRPGRDYLDDFFERLEDIRTQAAREGKGLSLVVFVHGWHHNAAANDSNVRSFRRALTDIAAAEAANPTAPRRMVGIYVGWRGDSLTSRLINWTTFWDRKNTAERISQGMVREFFSRLDQFRDRAQVRDANTREPDRARLLVIGHSFGGLIVYQSLSSEFLRSSARYYPVGGSCSKAESEAAKNRLTRFGDLVVIVNPAFEGTRYEPLKVSGERLRCLRAEQLPLVIIATSSADLATKTAFPIARYFNTIFERSRGEERRANVKTVGHNPRYTTHRLAVCAADDSDCAQTCEPPSLEPPATKAARAEMMESDRKPSIAREARHLAKVMAKPRAPAKPQYFCGGVGQRRNLKLTNVLAGRLPVSTAEDSDSQPRPELNPFWVVQTTKDIMSGHNDIFNPRLEAFVRQMYVESINDGR